MSSRNGPAALDEDFPSRLVGDGRPLLALGATGLIVAGGFAFFLVATGAFLPHDLEWLGLTAPELRSLADGRVADFMAHDRVAFGGTLIAIGVLYLWLVAFPLAGGAAWAWWLLTLSAAIGFASFLAWLGFGYLDTWHGVATLLLLPLFVVGLARSHALVRAPEHRSTGARSLLARAGGGGTSARAQLGDALLVLTAVGMLVAGGTIVTIGTVVVFVPQDLMFIGLDRAALEALNPRLVPLIAHDRSGFGGGLATTGLIVLGCVWCARPSPALWQALLVAGTVGFGAAVGVHGVVGYLDATHVGPAVGGAVIFAIGMVLTCPPKAARAARKAPAAALPGTLR